MCTMSGKLLRHLQLLVLAAVLPSCATFHGRTEVLITSSPAGAAVYLDGQDTGETTPIRLDLGHNYDRRREEDGYVLQLAVGMPF